MADAGLIVLTAFISPFRAEREMVRKHAARGRVHRDFRRYAAGRGREARRKGLYAKARAGELENFTGIDSPYEPPENPEIRIDTMAMSAEEAADAIVEELLRRR